MTRRLRWFKGTSEFLKAFPYSGGTWLRTGRGSLGFPVLPRSFRVRVETKFKGEAIATLWVQATGKITRIMKTRTPLNSAMLHSLKKKKIKWIKEAQAIALRTSGTLSIISNGRYSQSPVSPGLVITCS